MLKKIIFKFLNFFMSFFFSKEYLKGRWFSGLTGYNWCFKTIVHCRLLRLGKNYPFPASHKVRISNWKKIYFDPEDIALFQSEGCYFQNFSANIYIGKGTFIAPNVGLITANHDLTDLKKHLPGKDIIIGERCWIGMNSVLLPGVKLADGIIVGAGSVVTKSFDEPGVIVCGNPAKILRAVNEKS
ncbi:acyltransferase [Marinomonas rhizomae]|uniref:acyltransferase n=1 Tax=Marinomonas rhizomae TaxID=491948 RepID=UPI0021060679|nr:acyltransferase [Marinomonas rhizomae]UTW00168.1 acyltransferase [Marinomonas rhizomae]